MISIKQITDMKVGSEKKIYLHDMYDYTNIFLNKYK